MPLYMFQGRYSTNSIKSLIENPEDRAGPAGDLIASLGGKLHALYFCFGRDDVVAIIEAPDDTTMAACSMVVGASGTMSGATTTKLMTSAEAVTAMKQAGAAAGSYRGVGS